MHYMPSIMLGTKSTFQETHKIFSNFIRELIINHLSPPFDNFY